jgi:hypothetical protein
MRGGDDGPSDEAAADVDAGSRETDGGGGTNVAAICIEGTADCNDTIDLPASEYGCDQDGVCTAPGSPPDCAADAACEPLPIDPGCTYEECYPDIAKCEDLARRGELARCAYADPYCVPIEPAPMPPDAPGAPAEGTDAPAPAPDRAPLCPPLEDPCVADGSCVPCMVAGGCPTPACVEPMPLPVEEDPPVADDDVTALPAPDCPPPPAPCDDAAERCLPPDCAISSDGAVSCPEPSEPPQDGGGGSAPGSPGVTDPAPPDAAPEDGVNR